MKHSLDKTIDIRFHIDLLNTDAMQDVGHMKYLWPFKNDDWETTSNIMKITFIIRDGTFKGFPLA